MRHSNQISMKYCTLASPVTTGTFREALAGGPLGSRLWGTSEQCQNIEFFRVTPFNVKHFLHTHQCHDIISWGKSKFALGGFMGRVSF